jgi:hypothetical protein
MVSSHIKIEIINGNFIANLHALLGLLYPKGKSAGGVRYKIAHNTSDYLESLCPHPHS